MYDCGGLTFLLRFKREFARLNIGLLLFAQFSFGSIQESCLLLTVEKALLLITMLGLSVVRVSHEFLLSFSPSEVISLGLLLLHIFVLFLSIRRLIPILLMLPSESLWRGASTILEIMLMRGVGLLLM